MGEREERLREALERFLGVWDEFDGPPLAPQDTYNAVAESVEDLRAALASSPSPRDPDIVYKVEALILEHERNVGAFFATDQRTVERRQAAKRIAALFGRGDES